LLVKFNRNGQNGLKKPTSAWTERGNAGYRFDYGASQGQVIMLYIQHLKQKVPKKPLARRNTKRLRPVKDFRTLLEQIKTQLSINYMHIL
jgi:hypothetical protein